MNLPLQTKKMFFIALLAVLIAVALYAWHAVTQQGYGDAFINGNGRIEATEIDLATKLAGRVEKVLVREGDFVNQGQVLAIIESSSLQAQLLEAEAQHQKAITTAASYKAQITVRESDQLAAEALVLQRESELDALQRRLARSSVLSKKGAMSHREFDDDETGVHGAKAAIASAKAQVEVARAAIESAKADAAGAEAAIKAAAATVVRIQSDIADCQLTAPRQARVQYRIAEPGEVLPSGGKVLNLVDVSDVYMTFFLPEQVAGRVGIGEDARILLDAAPNIVIPAKISFVSSVAQFTPKTVETAVERQKLMFRIKAQISPELLQQHLQQVKTGLPGVTWVRIDPTAEWPAALSPKAP